MVLSIPLVTVVADSNPRIKYTVENYDLVSFKNNYVNLISSMSVDYNN